MAALIFQYTTDWYYTKKVDNKRKRKYNRIKRQEEKMTKKKSPRYSEEFKKTIVNLHQNGKSYAEIEQEYGVSHRAYSLKLINNENHVSRVSIREANAK